MKKGGQMKISFGMIFSIILIVIFLAFAFYAIFKFLGFQKNVQVGQFINYVQADVDKMYKGSQGSVEPSYIVPTSIDLICFTDFSKPSKGARKDLYGDFQLFSAGETNNLFFYPRNAAEGFESSKINHIDVIKMTVDENPYCIPVSKGKVTMNIKMDIGDQLVTITRP
jgi:hypothetical protein